MENKRIIRTNFYSNIANEILRSVIGQLSDGWGENNPANDKWWKFADVGTNPDGRVIIKVSTDSHEIDYYGKRIPNNFYSMSDDEVLAKFAYWIKKTAQMELKGDGITDGWKRSNTYSLASLSYNENITVAYAYFVYDTILGRSCSQFPHEVWEVVASQKKSDAEIKHETDRRAAHQANDDEYNECIKKLNESFDAAVKELDEKRKALADQREKDRKEAYQKWFAKQTEINKAFSTTK